MIGRSAFPSIRLRRQPAEPVPGLRQLASEDARGHHGAQDLGGAATDGEHPRVAGHAFQRQVARVAARAEALERVVGDLDRHLRGEDLGLGGQGHVREGGGAGRRLVDHQPGRGDADAHVREHPLQPLELGQRAAELLALADVGEGAAAGAVGDAQRHGRRADPLRVVGVHHVREPAPEPARRQEDAVGRDLHVLEPDLGLGDAAQPHRRLAGADPQPLRLAADGDEATDPLLRALLVEHPREHQMQARDAAAGDPVLRAVDDVAVAALVGAGGHLPGRASRAGLGDADRGLVAGEHQPGAEPLLGLRAVVHQGGDRTHVRLDHDAAGDAAHLRHLVDDQRRVEEAPPPAAVAPGDGHAHEAGVAQGLDVVPWILLGAVHLRRARLDGLARKRARPFLQRLLLRRQIELRYVVQPIVHPVHRHRLTLPNATLNPIRLRRDGGGRARAGNMV